jgi:hypothetical protein
LAILSAATLRRKRRISGTATSISAAIAMLQCNNSELCNAVNEIFALQQSVENRGSGLPIINLVGRILAGVSEKSRRSSASCVSGA